ncbi:hypothetical protein [Saccharopolyspora griseoalba]|uniref:Uncharacterized protein n=1 Tax=Saccharopolyspora griseoalba TaxID=1431848 RepID=A0ABW2LSE1_9PSEU
MTNTLWLAVDDGFVPASGIVRIRAIDETGDVAVHLIDGQTASIQAKPDDEAFTVATQLTRALAEHAESGGAAVVEYDPQATSKVGLLK